MQMATSEHADRARTKPSNEPIDEREPKPFRSNEMEKQIQMQDRDDAKAYLDIFASFDKENRGVISMSDFFEICTMLGRTPNYADSILRGMGKTRDQNINIEEYQHIMSEFEKDNGPNLAQFEHQHQINDDQRLVLSPDTKVIDFIRLLNEYQRKCEEEGKYAEAKLSKEKIEEVKIKETLRQENFIKAFQEEELSQVEQAQKLQFIEFNKAWDDYMADYEATAYMSLEKLKEKHMREIQELQERLRREFVYHYKPSKQLIELRQKEKALVKVKKYSEAEKIKAQADKLEDWERSQKEKDLDDIIEKKTLALRKQQQRSLNVLLKRIQKDRNQQLKNRQMDSQKLILKNRNLRNELLAKHAIEARHAIENIRNNLSLVHAYPERAPTANHRRVPTTNSKSPYRSHRVDGDNSMISNKLDKSKNESGSKDKEAKQEFNLKEELDSENRRNDTKGSKPQQKFVT